MDQGDPEQTLRVGRNQIDSDSVKLLDTYMSLTGDEYYGDSSTQKALERMAGNSPDQKARVQSHRESSPVFRDSPKMDSWIVNQHAVPFDPLDPTLGVVVDRMSFALRIRGSG